MIWNRVPHEMIRLYSLYERKYFRELADYVKRRFPVFIHTIVECSGGTLRVLSSNIADKDEIQFLIKSLNRDTEVNTNRWFQLSEMRTGIEKILIFSLEFAENQKLGYWIVESQYTKHIFGRRKMQLYARVISLLLYAQKNKEIMQHNLEIDEQSGLPCNLAFVRLIQLLQKQEVVYTICVFRVDDYRANLLREGVTHMQNQMSNLIKKLEAANIGKNFYLSEDTLAVLSWQNEKEVYAILTAFADENELWQTVRIVMIPSLKISSDDVIGIVETSMSFCKTGMIWRYGKDGINALCVAEGSEGT